MADVARMCAALAGKDENALTDHIRLIRSEVATCHWCWGAWKRLYMDDEAIRVRYAANAGEFFRIIRDSILDDVLMTLARMLDAPVQGQNQNLVISNLIEQLDLEPGSTEALAALASSERLMQSRDKVKVVRHTRLAHNDRETVAKQGNVVHYGVTDTDVDDALERLSAIMTIVDRRRPPDQPVAYETRIGSDAAGHVMDLIARTCRPLDR